MHVEINITDEDISFAERILLASNLKFDEERREFIKNFKTIDLQAIPGSGKTTALLAKLIILERYLPFDDGAGILVLSHTNAAVDEIKHRIARYCPNLFAYPNFVGTIQGFVDNFLAIPYYLHYFKKKPFRIDAETYSEYVEQFLARGYLPPYNLSKDEMRKIYAIKHRNPSMFNRVRYDIDENGEIIVVKSMNDEKLEIKKPGCKKTGNDYTVEEKEKLYQWFYLFKENILHEKTILHYDDAYYLANSYLGKFPLVKHLLQRRFRYVFVDEMQDMDKHQYQLLENIFFDNGNSQSVYQRIGDKNQAIYTGKVKLEEIWQDRGKTLKLTGSCRLTKEVATVVQNFGLDFIEIMGRFKLPGGNTIKPHVLVYDNDTIGDVIPKFAEIIKSHITEGNIPDIPSNVYKAIGWRKEHDDDDKIAIREYWANYSQNDQKPKTDYSCLRRYLLHYDRSNNTLAAIRKNILNALLHVLRLEDVKDDNRFYTKAALLRYLRDNHEDEYDKLKLKLFQWSMGIVRGRSNDVYVDLKIFINEFLRIFKKRINRCNDFINNLQDETRIEQNENSGKKDSNFYEDGNVKIEITTVHGAKGQNHTATLYLETFNYGKYESERPFKNLQKKAKDGKSKFVKPQEMQSAKMVYVGFSRPTHLLCFAVHKKRFQESAFNEWEVEILNPLS